MKKAFVILMAAFLLLSTAGVVMAEPTAVTVTNKTLSEASNYKEVSVNVTLDLGSDYTVTIPADFNIEKVSTGTNLDDYEYRSVGSPAVSVSVTLLEDGATIYVNVSSDDYEEEGNWTLKDGSHKLPYWLKATTNKNNHITDGTDSGILESGANVLTVTGSEGREPVYLHAKLIEEPTITGTYKDKLTFSVRYVDPPVSP